MELQIKLVEATAHHVYNRLQEAMRTECVGCLISHGSQKQHMCLMMEGEEYVRYCLDKALTLVDWHQVKSTFWKSLNVHLMLQCHPCYDKTLFFQKLWQDKYWKNQLVSVLVNKQNME